MVQPKSGALPHPQTYSDNRLLEAPVRRTRRNRGCFAPFTNKFAAYINSPHQNFEHTFTCFIYLHFPMVSILYLCIWKKFRPDMSDSWRIGSYWVRLMIILCWVAVRGSSFFFMVGSMLSWVTCMRTIADSHTLAFARCGLALQSL